MELNPAAGWLLRVRDVLCHGTLEKCPPSRISGDQTFSRYLLCQVILWQYLLGCEAQAGVHAGGGVSGAAAGGADLLLPPVLVAAVPGDRVQLGRHLGHRHRVHPAPGHSAPLLRARGRGAAGAAAASPRPRPHEAALTGHNNRSNKIYMIY